MKSCIILLSHADDTQSEEILYESIISILTLNLPIILVSHAPISKRNQELCDFCFFDSNNILFKESDFFSFDLPINEESLNYESIFGQIKTKNYLRKKTYQGAVINLITSGLHIANALGYEYGLLWEYDFILNEKSKNNLLLVMDDLQKDKYDCFFIFSKIYNKHSVYPVPQVFPIKKLLEYNAKIITTPKDYVEITKLDCCEEWLYKFYKKLNKPLIIDYNKYHSYFPDLAKNLSSAPTQNPCFSHLTSGVFIDRNDKTNWIYGICNASNFTFKYTCKIIFQNKEVYFYSKDIFPQDWFYNTISKSITNEILTTDNYLEVVEEITYKDTNEIFQYKIDNDNFETISKVKSFVLR